MKYMMKSTLSIALGAGALTLAAGCASTQPKQVLVCPECRIVVEQVSKNQPEHDIYATREERRHSCPGGCQGAMTTFMKEGKWEHKCSVCAQGPYTCSLTHPTAEK